MSHVNLDGLGGASRGVTGGAKMIEKAFDESTTPGDAFASGALGTAGGLLALAPVVAISLPVVAVASVAVGTVALFKKLLK